MVQGIGKIGAAAQTYEGVCRLISISNRCLAPFNRHVNITERQTKLGEIAGGNRAVSPVLLRDSVPERCKHRRHRLPEPPKPAEIRCGLV